MANQFRVIARRRRECGPPATASETAGSSVPDAKAGNKLLRLIQEAEPDLGSELATLSGRKQGNLTRTLKTLQRYGLVERERAGRARKPRASADRFKVAFGVESAG